MSSIPLHLRDHHQYDDYYHNNRGLPTHRLHAQSGAHVTVRPLFSTVGHNSTPFHFPFLRPNGNMLLHVLMPWSLVRLLLAHVGFRIYAPHCQDVA